MEPYIVTILVILLLIIVTSMLVYNIYKRRTQEPNINLNDIVGVELPAGVDLNDALGGMLKK